MLYACGFNENNACDAIIKATITTSKMSQIEEKLERMCDHEGSNINHYEK